MDAEALVAGEAYPSPYRIYDGSIACLLAAPPTARTMRALLARPSDSRRLVGEQGRALVAVWICDFTEADLEPALELQISAFASFRPAPPVQPPVLSMRALAGRNLRMVMPRALEQHRNGGTL
ncbi:hypothetical protein [Kouleothrix sp.]|uniref:hypothetical protein n=1 Tax=Kouleothrix sp. TaxID=2779161 RepID=UPI003918C028